VIEAQLADGFQHGCIWTDGEQRARTDVSQQVWNTIIAYQSLNQPVTMSICTQLHRFNSTQPVAVTTKRATHY